MKLPRSYLAAPTLVLFGSLLLGGCYTQFVLADRDPDDATVAPPVFIDQPPVVFIDYNPLPTIIDFSPLYTTAPVATGGGTGSRGTATQPTRDSGNQRTTANPRGPAAAPPRSGGSTAPAPAPARSSESRPAGGSTRR